MTTPSKRLYRARYDRKLAGVCGGLAHYFNLDPTLVRVAYVLLSIFPGTVIGGIIVYVVLALVMPEEPTGGNPRVYPPAETQPPGPPRV